MRCLQIVCVGSIGVSMLLSHPALGRADGLPTIEHNDRGTVAVLPVGLDRQIVEFIGPDAADIAPGSTVNADRRIDLGIRLHVDPIRIIRSTVARSSITAIRLHGVPVSDETVSVIAQLCPNLRTLILENISVCPSDELADLADAERQSLVSSQLTVKSIAALSRLEQLKAIALHGIDMSPDAVGRLSELTGLETLSITDVDWTDDSLVQIGELRNLETLCLRGTRVCGSGIAYLQQCPRLRSLNLERTPVDSRLVEHFQHASELRLHDLDVSSCELDSQTLNALRETLPFTKVIRSPGFFDAPVPEWLNQPQSIRKYRAAACRLKLHFQDRLHVGLADAGSGVCISTIAFPESLEVENWTLAYVGWIASTQNLKLARSAITDQGLSLISPLTRLESLDLAHTAVGDEGIRHLRSIHCLTMLDCTETSVTNAALDVIVEFQDLERLLLSDTAVTDLGVATLSRLHNLRALALQRCQVTDACGEHLAALPSLEALDLRNTPLTPDACERLQRLRPGVVILFQQDEQL